jgi:hypothetical protein
VRLFNTIQHPLDASQERGRNVPAVAIATCSSMIARRSGSGACTSDQIERTSRGLALSHQPTIALHRACEQACLSALSGDWQRCLSSPRVSPALASLASLVWRSVAALLLVAGSTEITETRRSAFATSRPRSTVHQHLCAMRYTAGARLNFIVVVRVFRSREGQISAAPSCKIGRTP